MLGGIMKFEKQRPVLVVDDDVGMREVIGDFLESSGHQVVTAANGREALRILLSLKPCCIILDLMMPIMNGQEFRKIQMADKTVCDIPVYVCSASLDEVDVSGLKFTGQIRKPLDLEALNKLMRQ
jgi:CheY-like chemotaxis protein